MRTLAVTTLLALSATATADAPKKHKPATIVFVLDRSGSMQGGKLDAVKQATIDAVNALDATDEVSVIVFDSEAQSWVAVTPAKDKSAIAKKIGQLQSGGGTNILPGLTEAEKVMHASKLTTKHVILLSDGEAPTDGLADAVKALRADKATLSTVAIPDADLTLLESLAKDGAGRLYDVKDLKKLSSTFVSELRIALK